MVFVIATLFLVILCGWLDARLNWSASLSGRVKTSR